MKLYSIKDVVISEFGVPFVAHNVDDAKRRCAAAYRDNPFVADLQLFDVCEFDELTGDVGLYDSESAEFVCNLTDIIGAKNETSES